MSKKTLKEKITSVCWWTLGLSVAYFAIGAYLKSDGPKFDPGKTYDLIKDTLTLTAAFLAPVAAFVLFSDWRVQHIEKSLEQKSQEIDKIISSINLNLVHLNMDADDDKYMHAQTKADFELRAENVYKEICNLLIISSNFDTSHPDSEAFLQVVGEIHSKSMIALVLTEKMFGIMFKCRNPSDFNVEYVGESDDDFINRHERNYEEFQEMWNEEYSKFLELCRELPELISKFQIKI